MFAAVTGFLALLFLKNIIICRADAECDEDLIQKVVEKLLAANGNQQSEMSSRISALEEIVTYQQAIINDLDSEMRQFRKNTGNINRMLNTLQAKVDSNISHSSTEYVDASDVKFNPNRGSDRGLKINMSRNGKNVNMQNGKIKSKSSNSIARKTRDSENVAFSAYLSHRIDHMSIGHHIVLDKIILNDGAGYNKNTGIFTVPVSGVYFFTFNINDHYRKTMVQLVVDGSNTVDVIADPDSSSEEAMSGNTAIIRVNVGQSVWIQAYHIQDGSLWSDMTGKYTTFSGALLY